MLANLPRLFFKNSTTIGAFVVSRLQKHELQEAAFLKQGQQTFNISGTHGMICLDPFCVAVWLPKNSITADDLIPAKIEFVMGSKVNASIVVSHWRGGA